MDNKFFNFLACCVIKFDGCFLLAHQKSTSNTFLPGGHVEPGEQITGCLKREIMEECGREIEIGEYLGAVEHCWPEPELNNYEINHIFSVKIIGLKNKNEIQSKEDHIEFIWEREEDIEKHNLLPHPLVDLLLNYSTSPPKAWWASTYDNKN